MKDIAYSPEAKEAAADILTRKQQRGLRAPTGREVRRHAARHDGGLAKKATRKYRRDAMDGLQNQQTALGLARVYLGGAGNPAMGRNVTRHIEGLTATLAAQEGIDLVAAHNRILARLQEVLDAFDAV